MSPGKSVFINLFVMLVAMLFLAPLPAAEQEAQEPAVAALVEQLQGMTLDEKVVFWDKRRQERQASMTPEQRREMRERRREMREQIKDMNPDERRDYWRKQQKERLGHLSTDARTDQKAMRKMLKSMSPEDRKSFWGKMRQHRLAQMTPEQRRKFDERHKAMQERINNMTPEEKKAWQERRERKHEHRIDDS